MHRFRMVPSQVEQTAKGPRLLDRVRNQLVPVGPEEQVRQSVLSCLVTEYGYPARALCSEELVARGTKNRDRADVLIRLPRSLASEPVQVRALSEPTEVVSYSAKVDTVKRTLRVDDPGFAPLVVPDVIDLDVDGTPIPCHTLGFVTLPGEGHALGLRPVSPLESAPPLFVVLLTGYGRTRAETTLASRLRIPGNEWKYDASETLAADLAGDDEETRLVLEQNVLSRDGTKGHMLLFADPDDTFGVMMNVDISFLATLPPVDESVAEAPQQSAEGGIGDLLPAAPGLSTLAVIECKAPGTPLTIEVRQQAERYAALLDAKFVALTNGSEWDVFLRDANGDRRIADLPAYAEILAGAEVVAIPPPEPVPEIPAAATKCPDLIRLHRRYRTGTIGQCTPEEMWLPILALDSALRSARSFVPFERHGVRFLEDLGINPRSPGSAIGAEWPGEFRDFLIEHGDGRRLIVGLACLGGSLNAAPTRASGSLMTSGWTYLIVGSSDDGAYECTLQFAFDKCLLRAGGQWEMRHDGALTAGRGSVKRDILFEALRASATQLMHGRSVLLGQLPHAPIVDDDGLKDILGRVAAYALVRRTVKQEVKASRLKPKL